MENVSGERFAAGEYLQWLASNKQELWFFTENDSGELEMETAALGYRRRTVVGIKWKIAVGFARRLTVVSFRWSTTALGRRRRTTVVGFKWRTLVVSGLLQVNNYSGWLQINKSCGFSRRTTVVSLRW